MFNAQRIISCFQISRWEFYAKLASNLFQPHTPSRQRFKRPASQMSIVFFFALEGTKNGERQAGKIGPQWVVLIILIYFCLISGFWGCSFSSICVRPSHPNSGPVRIQQDCTVILGFWNLKLQRTAAAWKAKACSTLRPKTPANTSKTPTTALKCKLMNAVWNYMCGHLKNVYILCFV